MSADATHAGQTMRLEHTDVDRAVEQPRRQGQTEQHGGGDVREELMLGHDRAEGDRPPDVFGLEDAHRTLVAVHELPERPVTDGPDPVEGGVEFRAAQASGTDAPLQGVPRREVLPEFTGDRTGMHGSIVTPPAERRGARAGSVDNTASIRPAAPLGEEASRPARLSRSAPCARDL